MKRELQPELVRKVRIAQMRNSGTQRKRCSSHISGDQTGIVSCHKGRLGPRRHLRAERRKHKGYFINW